MATVTTEHDTVLTEPDASKVIRAAGYDVVSFVVGEPRKLTAFEFRVNDFEPYVRASLEAGLRDDVDNADKVAVDSLGHATVVVNGKPTAAREAVVASLKRRGIAPEGLEMKTWPELDATYVVAISGIEGADETRAVTNALAGVSKVVAVHVYQDAGTATLWLKEPCDALKQNVNAALSRAGFSVSRFELTSG